MKMFLIWNVVIYGIGWFSGLIPFMFKGIAATWELGNSWQPLHWLAAFYCLLLLIPFAVGGKWLRQKPRK
jgi:hypothetical protein